MQRAIKAVLEWLLALVLVIAATPMMLAIACIILVSAGCPVMYRERRLGLNGKPFTLLKFRTLLNSAGPGIAPEGDPRIFPAARVLRRWRADELPQLINVLRGDMNLIGPRPVSARYAAALDAATRSRLLSVRPGVTGPGALAFLGDDAVLGNEAGAEIRYLAHVLPAKVALDIDYLDHWDLALDARVLARTVTELLSPRARARSRARVIALLKAGAAEGER